MMKTSRIRKKHGFKKCRFYGHCRQSQSKRLKAQIFFCSCYLRMLAFRFCRCFSDVPARLSATLVNRRVKSFSFPQSLRFLSVSVFSFLLCSFVFLFLVIVPANVRIVPVGHLFPFITNCVIVQDSKTKDAVRKGI